MARSRFEGLEKNSTERTSKMPSVTTSISVNLYLTLLFFNADACTTYFGFKILYGYYCRTEIVYILRVWEQYGPTSSVRNRYTKLYPIITYLDAHFVELWMQFVKHFEKITKNTCCSYLIIVLIINYKMKEICFCDYHELGCFEIE